MSGRLIYLREKRSRDKHDHIIVCLENGDQIRYHDPRRFGLSLVMPVQELGLWRPLRNLGVDPFDPGFNANYLFSAMRKSKRRIRDFLIDPGVVAGLGNIYANEVLFRVGLLPTRRAWKVSRQIAEEISKVIPRVLEEAIRWRGTSFSDYRDGEDREGGFQKRLQVYNREGEDCRICASRIKKVRIGNRGAFYCPKCQG
jgi:formamidopyrimidine-DNA glycosylase